MMRKVGEAGNSSHQDLVGSKMFTVCCQTSKDS